MKKLLSRYFADLKTSLQTIIIALIPFAVCFSIMSDRTPFNYINILTYGLMSALIIFYVFKYGSFKIDYFVFFIVLLNITVLTSQIFNLKILEFPRTIILLSLFAILFYQFLITIEKKDTIFVVVLIGGLLFVAYFLFYYRHNLLHFHFGDRLGEELSDQNDLGKNIALFCLISLILIYKLKRWWKILPSFTLAIMLFVLLATGSISNLLTFVVVGSITMVVCAKRRNKLFVAIIIVGLALATFLLLQLPFMSYFKTRIDTIFNAFFNQEDEIDGSAAERFQLFLTAMKLFITRPVFGFGYNQVQNYTQGVGAFAHNNFAELLASFGIVGFVAYEVLLLFPLIQTIRHKKYNRYVISLSLYLFLFQLFLIIFRKKMEFVFLPLFYAISCYGYSKVVAIKFNGFKKPIIEMQEAMYKEENPKNRLLFIYHDSDAKQLAVAEQLSKINEIALLNIDSILQKGQLKKIFDVIDEFKPNYIHTSLDIASKVNFSTFGLWKIRVIVSVLNSGEIAEANPKDYVSGLKSKKSIIVVPDEQTLVELSNRCALVQKRFVLIEHKKQITTKNICDAFSSIYSNKTLIFNPKEKKR